MNARQAQVAEQAFQLLSQLDHGVRIDVLGLGTFTFHRYGLAGGTSRLLPGGGLSWPESSAKVLAVGFCMALSQVQQKLENSNGV